MHRRMILPAAIAFILFAIACSSAPKPETAPDPSRQVKVLGSGDVALLPISVAAGAHLKRMPGHRIAFSGVLVDSKEEKLISDEVIRRFGFIRPTLSEVRITCRSTVTLPAGSQPPSRPPRPQNCTMPDMDVLYGFTMFRVAQDSAYVGGNSLQVTGGRPDSHAFCIVLALRNDEWVGVRNSRPGRAEDCGR